MMNQRGIYELTRAALEITAVALVCCACGPDKMETSYGADGHSVHVAVEQEDTTMFTVKDTNSEIILQLSVSRPGTSFTLVTITGRTNESLCRTQFRTTSVDTKTSPAIQFHRTVEDLPKGGRNETRQWWYSNDFLLYSERLTYSPSGKIKETTFKGPHGVVLN